MRTAALLLAIGIAATGGARAVEGLDVETVTSVYCDRTGFLWIGSRGGLARYDGYGALTYEHDVADPGSLSDNTIRTVFEDRAGNLWLGTNTGGLNRLDRATGRFAHFRHDSANPSSISHDSVYAVAEDRDGRLWVATQGGLNRFDPASGRFERFPAGTGGPFRDYVATALVDRSGALWIGMVGGGLMRRDPGSGAFERIPLPGADATSGVFTLAEAPDGGIFAGGDDGLHRIDPKTRVAVAVPFATRIPGGARLVTTVAVDGEGSVWAGTFDTGVWRLSPGSRELHAYRLPGAGEDPLRVISIAVDPRGILWVGTWSKGLLRANARAPEFGRLDDGDVTAVLEDRGGRLWIGTYGDSKIERRSPDGSRSRFPPAGAPIALLEDRGRRLWVGTTNDLFVADTGAGEREVREALARGRGIGGVWIVAFAQDRRGDVWVGTGGEGLVRFGVDGTLERFANDPAKAESLSENYVTSILEDRDGDLWVGTRSGGLNLRPASQDRFIRFAPSPGDPTSLSHHSVSAILEDRAGNLWVGTSGGGLNRMALNGSPKAAFQRFGEKDGLIDDNVVSLLEDDDGTLWVGTRRGLSRFDPARGAFVNYDTQDGLPSAEFNLGAASTGAGALYFGTRRGLLSIPRGTPMPERAPAPTVLTSIQTLEGPLPGPAPSWATEAIEVRYGEVLSIEASVLDYGERRRHRYAYRLVGLNDAWVELGTRREITFTHLDPGAYTLRVRGRNDQGVWSETPVALRIRVVPPFWRTAWFRALVTMSVVGLAWAWHLRRTGTLQRRNRELVDLKEQREEALEEARRIQGELRVAYGRLRGLTRRLEAAKEEERKHIAREMHDEMGTALTTMKLNLQLLGGAAPEEASRRVGDSIGLIDRMIGLVRELSLDLRPPLLDELGLAAALRGYLEALSRRSGIGIELNANGVPASLPEDVAIAAFRVAQEAVTNVLRHGGASRVRVDLSYDPARLDLTIADDGRGFDVATAFERAGSGRHLGLLGMRERVEAMGGTLAVESAPGSGTRVHARLPVEDGGTP